MLSNESTGAVAVHTDGHSAVAIAPDPDFEARWTASRARGRAHERPGRRRFTLAAGVAGIAATAAAVATTFLRP